MKPFAVLALSLVAVACQVACHRQEEAAAPAATQTVTQTSAATDTHVHTGTDAATHTHPLSAGPAELAPAPAPSGAEPVAGPKLTPADEGTSDASFVAYRQRLLAAVKRRDVTGVVALADPKIRTSFGGGGGSADFAAMLARPGMWAKLETVVTHGGTFQGEGANRSFWAPYVYSAWPEERDAFEHYAVLAENVPLRKEARPDAPSIATLSYDIVARAAAPTAEEPAWLRVKTADGRTGFVEASRVHSPVGYRAGFMKVNGQWKMNALVAGD